MLAISPRFSQDIINPYAPLALRLSALLMVGVIRVHLKQTHYVYSKLRPQYVYPLLLVLALSYSCVWYSLSCHRILLSFTVDAKDAWKRLERAFQAGSTTAIDLTAPTVTR